MEEAKITKENFHLQENEQKEQKFPGVLGSFHGGLRITGKSCCTKKHSEYGNTAKVRLMEG